MKIALPNGLMVRFVIVHPGGVFLFPVDHMRPKVCVYGLGNFMISFLICLNMWVNSSFVCTENTRYAM